MVSRSAESGQLRRARVVATDRSHDLALLRLEGAALQALPLEEPGAAREGQAVALMGFPMIPPLLTSFSILIFLRSSNRELLLFPQGFLYQKFFGHVKW